MALQYLEVRNGEWRQTISWVDSELACVYSVTAIELMTQLWAVARARYAGAGPAEIQVFDGNPHEVLAEARRSEGPVMVRNLSRTLRYHSLPADLSAAGEEPSEGDPNRDCG
jgi:hypothetical protein